ncbi:MAG TPA: hypothetical protein VIV09_15660 [Pseudolabrys sp.]
MSKLYLDHDPISGISHWTDTDEETGITSYGADQQTDDILEANRAEYTADHGRWGEWTKVASIPMVFFADLMAQGIVDASGNVRDPDEARKKLKTILNDSDYQKLRTRPGTV